MGLVNQLLQLYEECRVANRDVYLSFELRDGVESFSFKNILRPSSPPPSSGGSGRRRRRQRGPRRRNRQRNDTAAVPSNECDVPGEAAKALPRRSRAQPWSRRAAPFFLTGPGKTTPQRRARSVSAPLGFCFDAPVSPGYGRDNPSTMKYG